MATSLNRRELLALAAAAGAVAISLPAFSDTAAPSPAPAAPAAPSSPAAAPEPTTTLEGVALVSAAFASAGYALPDDQIDEVRKQLAGYPGDFIKARKFALDNADAPNMDSTAQLPKPKK